MAFVGRMSCPQKLFDNEVFEQSSSRVHSTYDMGEKRQRRQLEANCSRTYFKTYDLPSPVDRSDRCKAPNVDSSASCCELTSMTETEMSTLRCTSIRSYETETETLMMSPLSPASRSDGGSMSPIEMHGYLAEPIHCVQPQPILRGSTTSMCSWEDRQSASHYELTRPTEMETETQSSSVPHLDLGSELPSYTYDHHGRQQQHVKLVRESNEAYDNWLSGKRRQLQYRAQEARKQRELQQETNALRRQLNEQRVREWCAQKRKQQTLNSSSSENVKCRPRPTEKIQPHGQLDKLALRRLEEWELNKMRQAQRRREVQQLEARQKQQEQLQRKEQASRAWQHWIKGVAQRPKPVPLNQGIQTLRGTISELYINPNQWQRIDESVTGH